MAARPMSARVARRPTPLQSQSDSVPEIARFKVFDFFCFTNSYDVRIISG